MQGSTEEERTSRNGSVIDLETCFPCSRHQHKEYSNSDGVKLQATTHADVTIKCINNYLSLFYSLPKTPEKKFQIA